MPHFWQGIKMRLLNIYTLNFREFSARVPPYYILSHRWGEEEVSYEEFSRHTPLEKEGYRKIVALCKFIRERQQRARRSDVFRPKPGQRRATDQGGAPIPGTDWVWVDTCCIDKRSSAELSEAINSSEFELQRATKLATVALKDGSEVLCRGTQI